MTDVDLRLGRWQDVLTDVECDALIVDAPYSDRTHAGHCGAVAKKIRPSDTQRQRFDKRSNTYYAVGEHRRRSITYASWGQDEIRAFVQSWSPRTRGWIVSITDTELTPLWAAELEAAGRYVFSPLAFVELGSRVRLTGDGPTQWSCFVVVARPRSPEFVRWGALPGAYVGSSERKPVIGGKPIDLMCAIVRDYTRPGDLVCDPCAGGGTTLLAARMEGRRAVGAEMMPEHYEIARRRLAELPIGTERQPALFDGVKR